MVMKCEFSLVMYNALHHCKRNVHSCVKISNIHSRNMLLKQTSKISNGKIEKCSNLNTCMWKYHGISV